MGLSSERLDAEQNLIKYGNQVGNLLSYCTFSKKLRSSKQIFHQEALKLHSKKMAPATKRRTEDLGHPEETAEKRQEQAV